MPGSPIFLSSVPGHYVQLLHGDMLVNMAFKDFESFSREGPGAGLITASVQRLVRGVAKRLKSLIPLRAGQPLK